MQKITSRASEFNENNTTNDDPCATCSPDERFTPKKDKARSNPPCSVQPGATWGANPSRPVSTRLAIWILFPKTVSRDANETVFQFSLKIITSPTRLDPSRPVSTRLDPSRPVSLHLVPCRSVSLRLVLSRTFRPGSFLELPDSIRLCGPLTLPCSVETIKILYFGMPLNQNIQISKNLRL